MFWFIPNCHQNNIKQNNKIFVVNIESNFEGIIDGCHCMILFDIGPQFEPYLLKIVVI